MRHSFRSIVNNTKENDSLLDQWMTHRMWFLSKMALSLKEKLKLALGDKTKESFFFQGSTDSSVPEKNTDGVIWTKWKEELELIKEQEIKNEEKYYRKMYTGSCWQFTVQFQSLTTRSDSLWFFLTCVKIVQLRKSYWVVSYAHKTVD